jgi:hypothetical protein
MTLLVVLWALIAAAAVVFGTKLTLPMALAAWAALAAAVCVGGAFLLQLQPVGLSTASGRIGGSFVHWGFRAGQGQLIPATVISWLIWTFVGATIIALTQYRSQPRHVLMILAWTVDVAALFYVLGVFAANRGSTGTMAGTLLLLVTVLLGMVAGSVALWWLVGTDRARMAALALAGGPPLVIGLGYGLFVAVAVIGGGRWN